MSQYHERRGAHRPPGLGPAGAIPWFIAAVAVVLIVVYATGSWGGGADDSGTNAASSGAVSGSSSTKTPSKTGTTKPSSTPTSTPEDTSTSAAPTVDHSQPVSVLNATKRSGLAAGAAAKLKNAGWTIRSTGNYSAGVDVTTVFYGRASLQATADAVAEDLGGSAVSRESADFGSNRVTAVLGADYQN
ncbi:LytR C-terminal domain-containing protein [Angustibacter sp. McL0619]|uniref:LytR C-terminal domain-containing protein n=1 Tax=Angustibacter sp. McL0619 TaxID=3415676 RepID=UPI003CF88A09